EKALVRARQVATQMAAGLSAHLGALIYASNQTPMTRLLETSNATISAQQIVSAPPPTPLAIRAQQVEESATVYAVFAIE
ncbi:MAG: SIMPL domain-containing protein, partial [Acidobacteriaceae bacterium]